MKLDFFDSLILRTPLLPFKSDISLIELKALFKKNEVIEAIFLSSPDLYDRLIKWNAGMVFSKSDETKLINTLVKYASRMQTRATPFGLFAGCALSSFSDKTEIQLKSKLKIRNTRLDMEFSCALTQKLLRDENIYPYLKFHPNTSLYVIEDKVRFVEYYYNGKSRVHQISSVDNSVYLQKMVSRAEYGATTLELAQELCDEGILFDEANRFVNELVESQILISELEPSVTDSSPVTEGSNFESIKEDTAES